MKKYTFWLFILTTIASVLGVLVAISIQNWWNVPKCAATWFSMFGIMLVTRNDDVLTKKSMVAFGLGAVIGAVSVVHSFIVGDYIDASLIGLVMLVGVWNIDSNKRDKNFKLGVKG